MSRAVAEDVLKKLQDRLAALASRSEVYAHWDDISEWHSGTRPIVAKYFSDQVEAFDAVINIRWTSFPRLISAQSTQDHRKVDADEERARNKQAKNAKRRLAEMVRGLISVLQTRETNDPDTSESAALFQSIVTELGTSSISLRIKGIVLSDLVDAERAYRGGAFKACVVMLGAALEGCMLGTLQRSNVLAHIATLAGSAPGPLRKLGTSDPALSDKIGELLSFEDLKACIHELISGIAGLGVDSIQSFRNAIHPWKAIRDPLYSDFDHARALHYLGSFKKISEVLFRWTP